MKQTLPKLSKLAKVLETELNTTQDSSRAQGRPKVTSDYLLATCSERERGIVNTALRSSGREPGVPLVSLEEGTNLQLQAFEICIRVGAEDLACALVRTLHCEVPVYLVHRAGEQGLLRVLRTLLDCQVPLKAFRCLVTIPMRMLPTARRKDSSLRLFSNSKCVTSNDLLRWACLTGQRELVR